MLFAVCKLSCQAITLRWLQTFPLAKSFAFCKLSGVTDLRPTDFAAQTGISVSYSSQILSGSRPCPQKIALAAFRAFGIRLGLLADMTEDDIARLCSQQGNAADLNADVAAARAGCDCSLDHAGDDSPAPPPPSTGQDGKMSRAEHGGEFPISGPISGQFSGAIYE